MQTAVQIPHDVSYLDYKGKYKGIFSWIFSTDHKRIGLMYMYSMMVHFDFWFSINTVFLDLVCLMKPKTLLIV